MRQRLTLPTLLLATSVTLACGGEADQDKDASNQGQAQSPENQSPGAMTAEGAASANAAPSEPFPEAPDCEFETGLVTGTFDGMDFTHDIPTSDAYSNWSTRTLEFGFETGVTAAPWDFAFEVTHEGGLKLNEKVAVTGGFFFLVEPHPLAGNTACITGGEIGVVAMPPDAEGTFMQFTLTGGNLGTRCEGDPVDFTLHGCFSRKGSPP